MMTSLAGILGMPIQAGPSGPAGGAAPPPGVFEALVVESVALLKRGVRCMLGVREEIVALEIGIVAIHCGVLAWAATMAVFLVPGLPAL